jgi:hypothetical protein
MVQYLIFQTRNGHHIALWQVPAASVRHAVLNLMNLPQHTKGDTYQLTSVLTEV